MHRVRSRHRDRSPSRLASAPPAITGGAVGARARIERRHVSTVRPGVADLTRGDGPETLILARDRPSSLMNGVTELQPALRPTPDRPPRHAVGVLDSPTAGPSCGRSSDSRMRTSSRCCRLRSPVGGPTTRSPVPWPPAPGHATTQLSSAIRCLPLAAPAKSHAHVVRCRPECHLARAGRTLLVLDQCHARLLRLRHHESRWPGL